MKALTLPATFTFLGKKYSGYWTINCETDAEAEKIRLAALANALANALARQCEQELGELVQQIVAPKE